MWLLHGSCDLPNNQSVSTYLLLDSLGHSTLRQITLNTNLSGNIFCKWAYFTKNAKTGFLWCTHTHRIIILVSMTVIQSGSEVGTTIGNPQQLELMRIGQNGQPPAPQQNIPPPPGGNRGDGRYGGSYGGSGGAQNGMQVGGNRPQPRFGGGELIFLQIARITQVVDVH